jgi:hypothetical protein
MTTMTTGAPAARPGLLSLIVQIVRDAFALREAMKRRYPQAGLGGDA